MKRVYLIPCLLFLMVVAIEAQAWMLIGSGSTVAGGGQSYLLNETYDTSPGYDDADWTETDAGNGTIDEDATTGAASGEGLRVAYGTGTVSTSNALGASYETAVMSGTLYLHEDITSLAIVHGFYTSTTARCTFTINSDNTVNARLNANNGTATVNTLSTETLYYYWIHYDMIEATDYCSIAFNTSNSEPTSGDGYTQTTGSGNSAADNIVIRASHSSDDITWDNTQVQEE